MNYSSNSAFLDQPPLFPPYLGRRELSPPGMYSNLGLPFHKFDAHGAPPPHRVIPYDDHPSFMHNIRGPGVPPHISERKPWGTQVLDYLLLKVFLADFGMFTQFAVYQHTIEVFL